MNAAVVKQLDCYTIEDIYNLPDGERAELIDGEIFKMDAPCNIPFPTELRWEFLGSCI